MFSTYVANRPKAIADGVVIEDDVWIGASSVILSGVTVGFGSLVAAGSVVTTDIRPFEIVAGSPARHKGWRFDRPADQIEHRESILRWKSAVGGR